MKFKRIILPAAAFLTFCLGIAGFAATKAATTMLFTLISKRDSPDRQVPDTERVPIRTESVPTVAAIPLTTEEESTSEESTDEFYAAGSFYLDTETIPKEFRDIDHLEIVTHDYAKTREDGTSGVPIPPKGWLQTKKPYDFVRIAIIGKEISFQTETVNGVSYRFTGQYHPTDYGETDGETPDLGGQLIKIRDGKWAASIKAKFFVAGC